MGRQQLERGRKRTGRRSGEKQAEGRLGAAWGGSRGWGGKAAGAAALVPAAAPRALGDRKAERKGFGGSGAAASAALLAGVCGPWRGTGWAGPAGRAGSTAAQRQDGHVQDTCRGKRTWGSEAIRCSAAICALVLAQHRPPCLLTIGFGCCFNAFPPRSPPPPLSFSPPAQLHAAVVELYCDKDAEIKYSTVQNWYAGDANGRGGIYNFVTKRGLCAGPHSKISWTQVGAGDPVDGGAVPGRAWRCSSGASGLRGAAPRGSAAAGVAGPTASCTGSATANTCRPRPPLFSPLLKG